MMSSVPAAVREEYARFPAPPAPAPSPPCPPRAPAPATSTAAPSASAGTGAAQPPSADAPPAAASATSPPPPLPSEAVQSENGAKKRSRGVTSDAEVARLTEQVAALLVAQEKLLSRVGELEQWRKDQLRAADGEGNEV